MRDLAILTFVTLDGVMQGPSSPEEDPSGGFARGGWAAPYWETVMPQVLAQSMAQPYDVLFGGKTYDLFAGHWPNVDAENPVARIMNTSKKFVVTSRDAPLTWCNATALVGDPATTIPRLKAEEGPLIQVHGSGRLIQSLLAADLIDEFRLWTFPLLVGEGKRLFAESGPRPLQLTKAATYPDGVTLTVYRRG